MGNDSDTDTLKDESAQCGNWEPPAITLEIHMLDFAGKIAPKQKVVVNYFTFENGWLHYRQKNGPAKHLPAWRIREVTEFV